MSNIQKALDLIGTFATGDTELAASLLDEGYIQHNLAYGTGRDAFVGSVEYLASAPAKTTVTNIRAFEDGDKVFLQTVYNFAGAGEQVAFDIFRFNEEGLIAEHWDNLAEVAGPNPSGRTQSDGVTEATDLDRTEENRALVEAFLVDVMQGKHPEKTPEYFAGDAYLQHNTGIADGLSGLGAALETLAAAGIQSCLRQDSPSPRAGQLRPGRERGHLRRQAHVVLRPLARGGRQDRRALGRHGDHRRPVRLAERERQVLEKQ